MSSSTRARTPFASSSSRQPHAIPQDVLLKPQWWTARATSRLFRITRPSCGPDSHLCLLRTIDTFKIFAKVFALTAEGPGNQRDDITLCVQEASSIQPGALIAGFDDHALAVVLMSSSISGKCSTQKSEVMATYQSPQIIRRCSHFHDPDPRDHAVPHLLDRRHIAQDSVGEHTGPPPDPLPPKSPSRITTRFCSEIAAQPL
jgi:hypothetical protein